MTGKKRKIREISIKRDDISVGYSKISESPGVDEVVIKPIGFPLIALGEERQFIRTDNPKLFNSYAIAQWSGTYVTEGTYIFDQFLFPDFAFEIISVKPGPGKITSGTSIVLQSKEKLIRKEFPNVSFDDIIGNHEAKRKCQIIMKYLQDPDRFGEWIPKNVLFYGHSGTGKTMTAKALANATNVPIFLMRATDLIGLHVGDGARKVHNLYSEASESSPCIIFIDELDAIGLDRKYQSIRGDVAEVVNALLSEMDGITNQSGIVTIGATNTPALLDDSIKNRFESLIEFKIFDDNERYEFLEKYSRRLPMPFKMDLHRLTNMTKNLSGRELKEKILKNALHLAILEDKDEINEEIIQKVIIHVKTSKNPMFT
ncbi:MAG: AAA family ATPase [Candidatus Helarchaeota archaeon]